MKSLITSLQPRFSSTGLKTMARRLSTACAARLLLLPLLALPAAVQAQSYTTTTDNRQIRSKLSALASKRRLLMKEIKRGKQQPS